MSRRFVVTGTDTGIGKTVFSAGLADFLGSDYWKPVQAGLDGETDAERVAQLGALSHDRILPERYRLNTPASPHLAADIDGLTIDVAALDPPETRARPLVIEGAGGVMVPLTHETLYLDVFARWRLPVVLCARTTLGTINHSLLSIEALRRRSIDIRGVAFIGDEHADSEGIICKLGQVRRLGRLPWLANLRHAELRTAFNAAFLRRDFET
ncbi:dethiobiotin synthase [Bradyrhizobium genosp. P]|uniref:dethiobiotin synthase n=1 Tax=Bradyrhizobium genosp. P TaxID=83641 RepID=UPI003CE73F0D